MGVRTPARPTSRRICDIARYSATQPPTGSESSHIGQRSYGGVQFGRDESGRDERPDVRIRHRSIALEVGEAEGPHPITAFAHHQIKPPTVRMNASLQGFNLVRI